MFQNLNFWEVGVLLLLALFIFGPERLPKVIGDGMRMLRGLREMARNATQDLSREIGTEITLEDLHPKTFIRKHLLSEEEEAELRRPFEDAYQDVKQITAEANDTATPTWSSENGGRGPNGSSYPAHEAGSGPAYPVSGPDPDPSAGFQADLRDNEPRRHVDPPRNIDSDAT